MGVESFTSCFKVPKNFHMDSKGFHLVSKGMAVNARRHWKNLRYCLTITATLHSISGVEIYDKDVNSNQTETKQGKSITDIILLTVMLGTPELRGKDEMKIRQASRIIKQIFKDTKIQYQY